MNKIDIKFFPTKVVDIFKFLENYGFDIFKNSNENMTYVVIYKKENIFLIFKYDIYDDAFYFTIRKGINGLPVDYGDDEVIFIPDLIINRDQSITFSQLIPHDRNFEIPLKRNAELFEKLCQDILNAKHWGDWDLNIQTV